MPPNESSFISIDPGENVGWALWRVRRKGFQLVDVGVCRPDSMSRGCRNIDGWQRKIKSSHRKFADVAKLLESRVGNNYVNGAVIELPEFWSGSQVGQAAARRGDLVKLTVSVGFLWSTVLENFFSYGGVVRFVTPTQWKGQLKKSVVIHRVKNVLRRNSRSGDCFDFDRIKTHAWDAVGIGLHDLDKF